MKNWHVKGSVRTRFGLLTGGVLLMLLLSFYVIGRYVLINMIRNVEQEIQVVGGEVKQAINLNFDNLRRTAARLAVSAADQPQKERSPTGFFTFPLLTQSDSALALVAAITPNGKFDDAWWQTPRMRIATRVTEKDLEDYLNEFPIAIQEYQEKKIIPVGMMLVRGESLCVALVPVRSATDKTITGYLLVGALFDRLGLLERLSTQSGGGMQVSITGTAPSKKHRPPQNHGRVSNVFSDTINYYSGGNWHLGDNTFETVLPLHDLRGNVISSISIQLPKSFTSVTHVALRWLTTLIAVVGMVFILPVFWFQARILLNPLTELARRIQIIGAKHSNRNCGRIDWPNEDEFGEVAKNINEMLETIARKNIEIEQAEKTQRTILTCIPDGLFVFDKAGKLVRIRKQPNDVLPISGLAEGMPLSPKYFDENDCQQFTASCQTVISQGTIRLVILHGNTGKETRIFEVHLQRMDDRLVLAVLSDVTASRQEHQIRMEAETRLSQVRRQESLVAFSAGLAHDINNAHAIILSTLEATWHESQDAKTVEAVAIIRDALDKGAQVTRDLMTFAGEVHLNLHHEDPQTYLHSIERLLVGVLGQNVSMEITPTAALPKIAIDPRQFWKVFVNLVKNASEAMNGRKGLITLSATEKTLTPKEILNFFSLHVLSPAAGVLFEVSDNGPGIPEEVQRHLFEPFFSTKASNRGLGMATVLTLIDAHHGAIAIDSTLGKGTSFRIWLPAAPALITPPPSSSEVKKEIVIPPFSCLMIDDDLSILASTRMLLERMFHATVFIAQNAADALAIFKANVNTIDLVLQDATLGSTDTTRIVQPLKTIRADLPIVIFSGLTQARIAQLFEGVDYVDFLPKPYTVDDLKRVVTHALASSPRFKSAHPTF
ncbi:MAG: ATP-binding protein [Kiritimatiellia bacterium]